MRIKKSYWIAAIIFAALFFWVISGYWTRSAEMALAQVQSEPQELLVEVETRTSQPVEQEVVFSGRSIPARVVDLRAETAGAIVEIGGTRGDRVKKGESIVQINIRHRLQLEKEAKAILKQRELEYDASVGLSKKGFQSETKLAEAYAQLETARAQLEGIQDDIKRTQIRSPFDGKLQERFVEVGDYVKDGDKIAELIELNPLVVLGDVTEQDVLNLRQGATARVTLGKASRLHEGVIRYIAPSANTSSRTFAVEVLLDNPDSAIPAGMTAEVRVPYGSVPAYFISPALLALNEHGALGVKGVNEQNVVEFYSATVVKSGADGVWVSGLPEQVRIITRGQGFARVGEKVAVASPQAG